MFGLQPHRGYPVRFPTECDRPRALASERAVPGPEELSTDNILVKPSFILRISCLHLVEGNLNC